MSGRRHRDLHRMRRSDETPHLLVLLIARPLGVSAAESEGSSRGVATDSRVLLRLCLLSHMFVLLSCANVWIGCHTATQATIHLTFVDRSHVFRALNLSSSRKRMVATLQTTSNTTSLQHVSM